MVIFQVLAPSLQWPSPLPHLSCSDLWLQPRRLNPPRVTPQSSILLPEFLFSTSVPHSRTLQGLQSTGPIISPCSSPCPILTSHLPSLNFLITISLFHSSGKTLSTYSAHPDLVWEACSLLRNWAHNHTHCFHSGHIPLTPSGPLLLADNEIVEVCSSHSVCTVSSSDFQHSLPQPHPQPKIWSGFSRGK